MRKKLLLMLSIIAEAFMIARVNLWSILFIEIILLTLSAKLFLQEPKEEKHKLNGWGLSLAILLQVLITGYALINWGEALTGINEGANLLKYFLRNDRWMPALLIVFSVTGFWSLKALTEVLLMDVTAPAPTNNTFTNRQKWAWCFMCALIPITICSENSFLYPLNDWVDVSCFITVGKSWMHGIIPYRDLLEQKGPYLYLLYGIASLFSARSYVGAYLLEVLSGTFFLYYSGKTISLYMGEEKEKQIIVMPLLSVMTFASTAFYLGGSTEEFCLPMLAYATYTGLKSLKEHTFLSWREWYVNGLFVSLILWSKYTVLGYQIGWLLFLGIHLLRHGVKEIKRCIGGMLTGFLSGTLPVLIYFGLHGALGDLFEVYFYDNIFLYPHLSEGSPLRMLLSHYQRGAILLVMSIMPSILLLFVFIVFKRKHVKEIALIGISSLVLFLTSFIGKWTWAFYTLVFTVVAAPGLGILMARCSGIGHIKARYALAILILLFSVLLTPNRAFMLTPKAQTVQYQFAELINQKDDATLLVYGSLDDGFYQAADVLPTCKAFCGLAAPIPEIPQLQRESVEKGLTDFVVARVGLDAPLYEEIASGDQFHLYRLK